MQFLPLSEVYSEAMVELWNKEIGSDFPMRKDLLMQNSFQDENRFQNGSYLAVDDNGTLVGFIVTKVWQEKLNVTMSQDTGWIQVLLVDSAYRHRGIGSELLNKAEKALQKQQIKTVKLGSDPWHYFPGIPESYQDARNWFERRGYQFDGNEYDLICEYTSHQPPALPELKNVTFSVVKEEEQAQLLAFLNRCFPGRWEYEAIQYFHKGGTGREFVVLKKENEIKAFCRINDEKSPIIAQNVYWSPLFSNGLGGAGPLGVDPSERKKGYGLAIVEAGIYFLRQRGIKQIVIDWTGLVNFYGKLGYRVWKTYAKYSKRI